MPPNYDFHNCLSPREFEEFVRDILEIKEKVPFEISGRGKDGGVDLRYWEEMKKIIVQVKCYQNNYNQLLNVLKNQEKLRARALNPTRYILVTSIKLELTKRDEIFALFEGLIKSHDDIIDRDDLNKLLGQEQYQHVERTHYKLWLSSTSILTSLIEEVVHRDILVASGWELEEIKKTVRVFVQNPSFGRALDILERSRYVLISGEAGIGKTTLGRCLSAYFLQCKGYKEFIYADTVGVALRMYKEKEKQVFFLDDFWGDIFKDAKLPHSERKNLLSFIRQISDSPNKLLIMTSREYVIQQGLIEYQDEQLKRTFDLGKCSLQLEDYSDLIKTKILFNHLYFSRFEWEYVRVIANGYERIIQHPNYSPRIIETFLNQGTVLLEDSSPLEFYKKFLKYLDEPLSFWKHIFINQTYGAQLTSLILFLSTQPMRLFDLKETYYSCIEASGKMDNQIQAIEFEGIITQLEKTMIKTYYNRETASILVNFHNPSIKDFLYQHLSVNLSHYGRIIIQGSLFLNQLLYIFKATNINRHIYDESDESSFSQKKIRLPKKLEDMLTDKIISEFDQLKYSYAESDVFEHKASIYVSSEDCIVRKLHDILFNFGVNENAQIDKFVASKIQDLYLKFNNEEYPLSYDDMVEFPYLIKMAMPLKIEVDGYLLINNYYKCSRFAEHLLMINEFEEVFPKEFIDFKKKNYKSIKADIKYVLLDDIDFFASDGEYDRVDFLIDFIYPEVLKSYKLRDSKAFWKEMRMTAGYDDDNVKAESKKRLEWLETNRKKIELEEEHERKTAELIKAEREALLGVNETFSDEEINDFIKVYSHTHTEARELIICYENEKPWYIYPFFNNWNRLSLLLDFYHDKKNLPLSSAYFYEQFASYLIKIHSITQSNGDVNAIVEMFSEFAFDMMKDGRIVFSQQNIENHHAFMDKLETGQIDLSSLLAFPFIVQRGKWYEFQTLMFQVYLSLKKILSHNEKQRAVSYVDFLNLKDAFLDHEHDIWVLCSELDLQVFNQNYLVPILNEYLTAVNTINPQTVCSSAFRFFELVLNFKIPQNTLLPSNSGSSCNGLWVSALEFIDHDLLEVELYMSSSEDEVNNNHSELLRLSGFIMQHGSEGLDEDEYELDLAKHIVNPELLEILDDLGVCSFLWNSYHQILEIVENTVAANYNLRLDSYTNNPQTRRFALVD
ncbi:restriction endonuclease [Paenibacillus sp. KS-LC4]|uniref:nSTAND3 domain-containing NTPase n=1 Tax=Paenibacillus sp. KS-LC4 TaxID=2979727 RepID=UPI0030D34FC8